MQALPGYGETAISRQFASLRDKGVGYTTRSVGVCPEQFLRGAILCDLRVSSPARGGTGGRMSIVVSYESNTYYASRCFVESCHAG